MVSAHPTARTQIRRLMVVPMAVVIVAGAAACGSSSKSTSATTTEPTTTELAATLPLTDGPGACVTDVDKVINTKPTPASTTASLPADLVSQLDAAAQSSFKEAAAPGAIVGVRTPQGTWIQSYGYADPSTKAPMAADMHVRIGSVTKTLTGTVILQLAEQGKLSLDDPISKYVPGIPNGDRVTLRLLANMTSGVASYSRNTAFTDKIFGDPAAVLTPDELIAYGVAMSPIFEPGAQFDYSNTNTVLLGKVIEQLTGQSIGDVFQQRINGPLAMAQTSWPGISPAIPEAHPQGYTLQGNTATPANPSNATNWNPSWGFTAGEVISTVDDLLVYGRALGTGQGLLGPAAQAERLNSIPGPKGYGLAIGCIDGWVGHTGELPGFNTSVFYDTTTDSTVIVETNSDIASGDCPESPTLTDDPHNATCSSPATRMFVALSTALGHTFTPNLQK
jgi:D-alanyl-D-alanine carboxypeptidase